ncbi:MAG: replicative DNA helicase [Elusimicrobia bacterium CG1_02_63_36]|nr:MAG: replicative DNA helicase [Elusimicrobia bacterium CG1_02_63_36]PIP81510.1 MAG: replicative DNA helicase [Elusimicrobia bacterium CG22_combo_CG10-13_8_21_14_all_63_91]PJA16074.1 MAG: replicative DNA helicase [Elusimicrobia bacterium CG_4_10_14_0_2_um_filter_63_34]PJB26381.1 MAG: replicative DNA helicase [Elusimicrobia bacterium CG_4_9_14_3_um_filter_62_55]
MSDTVRVPPQALDAERAVLGSMLIEPEAVERALEILNEKSFYKDSHRKIFAAAVNMQDRGQPVDLVTMSEELKRRKSLGDVGGSSYLKELTHSVSTAAHVEHYARLVHDKAILRELITLSTTIVSECHGEKEPSVLLDQAQGWIFKLTQQQQTKGFTSAKELAHQVIEDIERLQKNKGDVTGVPTGLKKLDSKTAGFQKGDMIIIGARPSQGKTALALNIAAHIVLHAKEPQPVAIFSMEMSKQAIMTRFIASEARVNLHEVRNGFFRRDRWTDLTNAAARLSEAPLYIEDTPGLSVLEVRSQARRLANELASKGQQLGIVLLDYLQLMRGSSHRSENRQQEVSEISRGLKGLARDLNVPIVVLSQLSRRVEDKGRADARPQLSDLRESGAIEQDADVVAFIYREGYYKRDDPTAENKAEIIIAKQRNGPTGTVELMFRPELARFENLEVMPDTVGDEEEAQVSFS